MTNGNGAAGATEQSAGSAMPMLYSNPEALNPKQHGGLGLIAKPGFDFARSIHAIPLMAAEMPAALRSYPIVFAGPHHMPLAIAGVRMGENLFIEKDGSWTTPNYVPAYVRRYPFVLAGDESAERLTLCVERDSERVVDLSSGGKDAEPLPFFDGEQPSESTKKALAFCDEYQKMHNATRALVDIIAGHNLFVTKQSSLTLEGGETLRLTDFEVIDENAFNALSDEVFLELRKSGALLLIYSHFASMNSWNALVHRANTRK